MDLYSHTKIVAKCTNLASKRRWVIFCESFGER